MSDVHELAPLYALDALDDLERRRFERHLDEGCERCETELAEADLGVAHLARAYDETPPPDMREAVMSRLVTQPDAAPQQRATGRRNAVWVVVAAVVALVVLFALPDTAGDPLVLAVLNAEDVIEIGVEDGPGPAEISLSFSPSEGGVVFEADDLERPGEGRVYQLWLIGDDGPVSGGTFVPDDDGTTLVRVAGVATVDTVVGLTEEPVGGSPAPTGDILVAQPLGA